MFNDLSELEKNISKIKEMIPSFDTLERKEIKKNNKFINENLEELKIYKSAILNEMLCKKNKELDKYNYSKNDNEQLNNLFCIKEDILKEIEFLSDKSFFTKLKFDEDIYNLNTIDSLEEKNKIIKFIISKFKLINIELNQDNFKFNIVVYDYMNTFFNNINNEDFNEIMKDKFNSIFWKSPNIIEYLSICFYNLITNYKKEFESYIDKINKEKNIDSKHEEYLKSIININDYLNKDKSYNLTLFLNEKLDINSFIDEQGSLYEIINKFIKYEDFLNYNNDEICNFLIDIKELYYSLIEYKNINDLSILIDNVKLEENKVSNKELNNLKKSTIKLLNKRNKINKKIFKIYYNTNSNSEKNQKKVNELLNSDNLFLNNVIEEYKKYKDLFFKNNIFNVINENSSIYDLLLVYDNNYFYLKDFFKENKNANLIEEYYEFKNLPYFFISKNVGFLNYTNIKQELEEKYKLFNISFDIEKDGIDNMLKDLKILIKYLELKSINFNFNYVKILKEINALEHK